MPLAARFPLRSSTLSSTTRLLTSRPSPRHPFHDASSVTAPSVHPVSQRTLFTKSPTRRAEAAGSSSQPMKTTSPPPASEHISKSPSLENLDDQPLTIQEDDPSKVDWTRSFHGLSVEPFSKEAADTLQAPLNPEDIEIKPDGIVYLPEIKYRRILNKAFGPGGWGLAPRGETIVTNKSVTREYALLAHGR